MFPVVIGQNLPNNPSRKMDKVGECSTDAWYVLDWNSGFSGGKTTRRGLRIPLKSGGFLPMSYAQFPAQGALFGGCGPDGWTPVGTGGQVPFYRYIQQEILDSGNNGLQTYDGTIRYDAIGTIGSITYFNPNIPAQSVGLFNASAQVFRVNDRATGSYFLYGGYSHPTLPGRLLLQSDRNGNVLAYSYSARSPNPYAFNYLLRKITGDVSVIPYFNYSDERLKAPITKIGLVVPSNPIMNRYIYYEYDNYVDPVDITGPFNTSSSRLTTISLPEGLTPRYKFHESGIDAQAAVYYQYDADGYTSYFSYEDSSVDDGPNRKLKKSLEPLGRITYFNYADFDGTTSDQHSSVCVVGRPPTYYQFDTELFPHYSLRRKCDALRQTTYYEYDSINDRVVRQIDPNGRVVYFEYNAQYSETASIELTNASSTRKLYTTNDIDLRALVGPRNSVPLKQATYFSYDARRNLTDITDPLSNVSHILRDGLGRGRCVVDRNSNATYFNFDANGLNRSIVWPTQSSSYFTYDHFGNRTTAVSPRWTETSTTNFTSYFAYDAVDRLRKTRDPLGNATYFTYTGRHDLASIIDARGTTTDFTYNAFRRVIRSRSISASSQLLRSVYFDYDLYKNRIAEIDELGNQAYYAYDVLDRLLFSRDALGNQTYFGYDSVGNLVATRDARANQWTTIYDQLSRATTRTDPAGNLSYFGFDLGDNQVLVRDARGNAATSQFDALDRPLTMQDAMGGNVYFGYDAVGNVTKVRNQRGFAATQAFDQLNRKISRTDALGRQTYFGYDAAGNRTKVRDALGRATTTAYDTADRVLQRTDAASGSVYFGYDAVGNAVLWRDQLDQATTTVFDALNRPMLVADPLGNTAYFGYDARSSRTKTRNGLNHLTQTQYDALRRPLLVTNDLGQSTYFGYDANGNLLRTRTPLALSTTMAYDALNRVTSITNPLSQVVSFGYDANGNRRKEVDARSNATYFSYDAIDRLQQILDPLGKTTYFAYDATSNLISTVSSASSLSVQYDALGRKLSVSNLPNSAYGTSPYSSSPYGGGTSGYAYFNYDAVGNLTSIVDEWGNSTFSYDALNRLKKRQTPRGDALYFNYDSISNLTSIQYPGAANATPMVYDAARRMQKARSAASNTCYFQYDQASNLKRRRFGNGALCYYDYDNAERITGIAHVTSAGVNIASLLYRRDAAGRITRIARDSGIAIYYDYDNADRITRELWARTSSGAQIYAFSYLYDAAGNRTKGSRQFAAGVVWDTSYFIYNAANAATKRYVIPTNTATYFAYDDNGALLRLLEGVKTTYYEYGNDQFIRAIIPPVADGQPWQFVYDGLLNRTKVLKGASATYYLWNGLNQFEERDAAGTLRARYTHGPGIVPGVGSAVEVERHTATTTYYQYLHMDQQGSVVAVTDANQAKQLQYTNDAFGNQVGPVSGLGTMVPSDMQFQTNWFTFTIGTRRYGFSPSRVYDPELGRFLQRDPLPVVARVAKSGPRGNRFGIYDQTIIAGALRMWIRAELGGRNLYAHCQSNPTNRVDPLGWKDPPDPLPPRDPSWGDWLISPLDSWDDRVKLAEWRIAHATPDEIQHVMTQAETIAAIYVATPMVLELGATAAPKVIEEIGKKAVSDEIWAVIENMTPYERGLWLLNNKGLWWTIGISFEANWWAAFMKGPTLAGGIGAAIGLPALEEWIRYLYNKYKDKDPCP